mmetsp:Transcript_77533/g.179726  ORF Transcript_77533/g.179726 Transcript_77533/m.179726 type:complete len:128 (+) Transcript_77533:92-475(+)
MGFIQTLDCYGQKLFALACAVEVVHDIVVDFNPVYHVPHVPIIFILFRFTDWTVTSSLLILELSAVSWLRSGHPTMALTSYAYWVFASGLIFLAFHILAICLEEDDEEEDAAEDKDKGKDKDKKKSK